MRWVKGYVRLPASLAPQAEPIVQTTPERINEYEETLRLSLSTATRQTLTWRSGFTGTLEGVAVFTSAIDTGDYWTLSLRGKTIREKALPVANTALKGDYSQPIYAGDSLVLTYFSQGTTAKNIDMTPRLKYSGEGL